MFGSFGGIFPPDDVVSAIERENQWTGRIPDKKGQDTGQDKTVKKNDHNVVIFRLYGEKPPLYRLKPQCAWWVASQT